MARNTTSDTTGETGAVEPEPQPEPAPQPPATSTAPEPAPTAQAEGLPTSMAVVVEGGEAEPAPGPHIPATTKAAPFLLRLCYPHDELRLPGSGAHGADLVLTREWKPVSREQRDAARLATRGTKMRLKVAVPDNSAKGGA